MGAICGGGASEETVATIRDEQLRRIDQLAAGQNNIGYVSPATSQKVGQGRFNLAGTGRLTLSVAGNVRATFANPAGSGRNLKVVRISSSGTGTAWASVLINPTTGLPVSAPRPVLNAVAGGGLSAVGELRVDTDATAALGGGTDTGIVIGMPSGQRTHLDLPPIILTPGVTLGINVPFAGAADSAMAVYWIEDEV